MSEIRERLEAHRNDVSVLLREASNTATLYSGFRLAGAVSHLARAHVLLAEELAGLSGESKEAPASGGGPGGADEDATPVDGMTLKRK